MARVTVDFDRLMIELLSSRLGPAGVKVTRRTDTNIYTDLPLLRLSSGNGTRVSNGPWQLAQTWTLYATLLRHQDEASYDLDDTCYQQIQLMHDDGDHIPGIGQVVSVDDESMFTLSNEATLNEKVVEQLDASFTVIVTPLAA